MRISATSCCTPGWYAIDRVNATDVRWCILRTVSSYARCAIALYTVANPSRPHAKIGDLEESRAAEARRAHERDVLVGDEGVVEDRVVALGRAHAEHVPRLLDVVALGVARHERVHDLRSGRVARVHRVHAEEGPHRRQRAEDLVAGDLPAAVDALGRARRQQQRDVVARLAVPGREHRAVGRGAAASTRTTGHRPATASAATPVQ